MNKAKESTVNIEETIRNSAAQGLKDTSVIVKAYGEEVAKFLEISSQAQNSKNPEEASDLFTSNAARSAQRLSVVVGGVVERHMEIMKTSMEIFKPDCAK